MKHRFHKNGMRTNLGGETYVHEKSSRSFLKEGVLSNTITSGTVLEYAQEALGDQITHVCLNKNVTCGPHRDRNNKTNESWVYFFGDFTGGGLHLATGEYLNDRNTWMGPYDLKRIIHWNEAHEGTKYSVIAFTGREKRPK